jgi:predicted N-acetyltransferase YhbS
LPITLSVGDEVLIEARAYDDLCVGGIQWLHAIIHHLIIINKFVEAFMVTIRAEILADITAREALLDRAFGRNRNRKTSQRFRDGRLPAEGLAFTALSKSDRVIGTLRMWNVIAGSAGPALLLGPLAVDSRYHRRGIGRELMDHALNMAQVLGHVSVLLVGDEPYYSRFGFSGNLITFAFTRSVERNLSGAWLNRGALEVLRAGGGQWCLAHVAGKIRLAISTSEAYLRSN